MEKMSETTTEDRISALPDCVLLRILSFLKMNQVVRTSVLSKRWEYMWTSVPTLTFEYDNDSKEKIGMFVGWVNRTLLRCRDTGIDKFNVDFRYNQCYESDVDGWARFAADKKARDLSLHFVRLYPSESYSLPQFMFCSSILMNLSIRDCKLMPRGDLSWTSLKSLSIAFVELSDDVITKILCGSPMLEYLKIARCLGLDLLKINSKSLMEMVVVEDFTSLLEISAPNLQSLHISGSFGNVQLKSVSSLRRAELNFSLGRVDLFLFRGSEIGIRTSDDEYAKQCHHFIKLIGSLHHEVELELGLRCVQLLSVLEVKSIPLPSSRRKYLKLKANIDKLDLPGVMCLLKSLPYLEKLVIEESPETTSFQFRCSSSFLNQLEVYWKSERRDLNLSFLHLKTVEFSGFTSFSHPSFILNFIQLLLHNARVLKKMVINVGKYDKKCSSCLMSPDLLELSQKLLKIRRLSPHAEIIFS